MKDVVVGLGEVLWDCLPEGKQLGGAPANFAYHAHQFGHKTCTVSAIGHDVLGDEILVILNEKAIDYDIAQVDYPTGTVQVELNSDGVPCYEIKEDVAWDNIPFTPALKALAQRCKAVSFGSLAQRSFVSRSTVTKFLEAMPNDDYVLKVFDINLRQKFYSLS